MSGSTGQVQASPVTESISLVSKKNDGLGKTLIDVSAQKKRTKRDKVSGLSEGNKSLHPTTNNNNTNNNVTISNNNISSNNINTSSVSKVHRKMSATSLDVKNSKTEGKKYDFLDDMVDDVVVEETEENPIFVKRKTSVVVARSNNMASGSANVPNKAFSRIQTLMSIGRGGNEDKGGRIQREHSGVFVSPDELKTWRYSLEGQRVMSKTGATEPHDNVSLSNVNKKKSILKKVFRRK